jgi:hypothetical protein
VIGRRDIPLCSFVVAYLWRHPEPRDLLAGEGCGAWQEDVGTAMATTG